MDISALKEIYAEYDRVLSQAQKKTSIFTGLFGQRSMDDPRNHPCNREFYEKTGLWVKDFVASKPDQRAAAEVSRWILEAAENNKNRPVYWYFLISQGYVRDLVPFLSDKDREVLALEFDRQYPKRTRLPIQEEVYHALHL